MDLNDLEKKVKDKDTSVFEDIKNMINETENPDKLQPLYDKLDEIINYPQKFELPYDYMTKIGELRDSIKIKEQNEQEPILQYGESSDEIYEDSKIEPEEEIEEPEKEDYEEEIEDIDWEEKFDREDEEIEGKLENLEEYLINTVKRAKETKSPDEAYEIFEDLIDIEAEIEMRKDGLSNDIIGRLSDISELSRAALFKSWGLKLEMAENSKKTEEQKIEEERNKRKEQQKDKKLIELLKEQADVQSKITKASWAKSGREAKENINKEVKKLSNYLNEQAEIYGANKEAIKKIVDDYKEELEANENEKNEQIKQLEIDKSNLESNEQVAIINMRSMTKEKRKYEKSTEYKNFKNECAKLESEIVKATKDGDLDKADKILKEYKNKKENSKISDFDKKIEKYNNDIQKARDGIKDKKDKIKTAREELKDKNKNNKVNDIVNEKMKEESKELVKQNTFQKFIGSIAYSFKKIGGKKKFEEKVAQPIKEAISTVGSGIKSVPSKIGDLCDDIKNKKDAVINKFKESIIDSIEEKTEKLAELQATNER